ncbi:MAG: M6 family metalloprotease domain-containing protein [Candidatus Eisenbacteria sp.]|nr:M6 family metalloprotease domain-containing protein [Candidatus Eisenbacteria bacterium]
MTRHSVCILTTAMILGFGSGFPAEAIPPYPPGELQRRFKDPAQLSAILEIVAPHQGTTLKERAPAQGVFHVPVILIDFVDRPADTLQYPPSHFETLLFERAAGALSLYDYYKESSYGAFDVRGTVTPWLRSAYSYNGHYVNQDGISGTADDHGFDTSAAAATGPLPPRNVWGLVKEAVELADAHLDFSEFDNDHDGKVDAIIVVHAGCGAEFQSCQPSADQIWSHQSSLRDYLEIMAGHLLPVAVDGVEADIYTLNPEDGRLGVFCHEFGHTLGLPDFYNTTSMESRLGRFCLMDYGGWSGWPVGSRPSHLSTWCKWFLGWIEPRAIDSITDPPPFQTYSVVLPPVENEPIAYRILDNPNGVDWTRSATGTGEYFLMENRQLLGYDTEIFATAGAEAEGFLILHVDESQVDNNRMDRLLVSVVQADGGGLTELGTGAPGDLWQPGQELGPSSTPSSNLYGGTPSGVSVTGIHAAGADWMRATISRGEIQTAEDLDIRPNPWLIGDGAEDLHITYKPGAEPRRLRVCIYNLSGALIRVLNQPPDVSDAGGYARWDGKNRDGEHVAAGVYFVVVDNGEKRSTGKIAIVR